MRYKGEQTLEFSCDDEKNVTVVLGENTVGKTTIAQAFRWGLYGRIIDTKYDDQSGVTLLNNDVLGKMKANDSAEVKVEIVMQHKNCEYTLTRMSEYARKYPEFTARERLHKIEMMIKDLEKGSSEHLENKHANKIEQIIAEILPQNLSQYFFFDGERWNDTRKKQEDIKSSVYNLMGLSAVKAMLYHLKDKSQGNVLFRLKKMIKGKSNDYEIKLDFIEKRKDMIENAENEIKNKKQEMQAYDSKIEEIERFLNENQKVEKEQKKVNELNIRLEKSLQQQNTYYAEVVNKFSNSYEYFAIPLLEEVLSILSDVRLEGKDIPKLHGDTLDFLLRNGVCICGCKLEADSKERKNIEDLKHVIPPMAIGTMVKNYEKKMQEWKANGEELLQDIKKSAKAFETEKLEYEDDYAEKEILERKIDRKINFEQERAKLNNAKQKRKNALDSIYIIEKRIADYKKEIEEAEAELESLQAKSEKNEQTRRDILYAQALYEEVKKIFDQGELELITELNKLIRKNFKEMFKEQEKYAKLTKDYEIKLYYNNIEAEQDIGELEANGLSEGEKIARNFVFIVSIMEFAKNKKENESFETQSIPLVLDGPFSKLSADNIGLIAKVLPSTAEQVIVFMLDKDWEHTGLEEYTGVKYRVQKDVNKNSTTIIKA